MSYATYTSQPFIEAMMRQHAPEKNIQVLDCQLFALDNSASILAVLTATGQTGTPIGHAGLTVTYRADGLLHTRQLVLKMKPHGNQIVAMLAGLAQACGGPLADVYPTYQRLSGFQHTHVRELDVYGRFSSALFPEIVGLYADDEQGTYLILMEYLTGVTLLNSAMTPSAWSDAHIRLALHQLARWHAAHLDQPLPFAPATLDDAPTAPYMVALMPLWEVLLQNAAHHCPALYDLARVALLRQHIQALPTVWSAVDTMPKTLIHNDLNPRNVCFTHRGDTPSFCAYDWELATLHVPQYDVIELLCFVLDEDRYALRQHYLAAYYHDLHQCTGRFTDEGTFWQGYELAAVGFGLHRLGMYMMAHSLSPYPFLPRVVNSFFDTLAQLQGTGGNGFS